ncbi:phage holin family protein [Amycolatopsis sp. K13G38]|uniref:Phage holin family protein n=1 Tax=Amycolatopsis acididurans TaxID=2724524 RepID=A0ABX1JG28_9PSEU|nr:phage holin family protein [Amycolatopsis acididurans]NKQ57804.1 phage holin family protein [Amycolatopsis acididurans]
MTSGRGNDVAGELGANIGELVRRELRVAAREVRAKGEQGGLGVVLLGAAGVSALYAGGFALRGLVLTLEKALPEWLATLCVAGTLSVGAGVAGMFGLRRLHGALPLLPEQASAEASEAVQAAVRDGDNPAKYT